MYLIRNAFGYVRRLFILLLCLVVATASILPVSAYAGTKERKTVRVGWFESPFYSTDKFGNRSGYAYEYQQKIASYTGWEYEYVYGSWPELYQKFVDGDIDLMSDISHTEEREELMLFTSLPMGTEEYYLFITPDNKEYRSGDYSYFNGKRVGVNKGSYQIGLFKEWEEENDVRSNLIELSVSEPEIMQMLKAGELDAYLSLDYYGSSDDAVPVVKVGSSDFFFAVNKERPDLLKDINIALEKIRNEEHYYNEQLYGKYNKNLGVNLFLDEEEKEWVSGHGPIRVGYQDDYMSYCDKDEKTGELTGALKDFLNYASGCLANQELEFEPVAYPTAEAAIDAMKNGDVDCIFPAFMSISDAEDMGLILTSPVMTAEAYAITRTDDQNNFLTKDQVTTAVKSGDPNHYAYVREHFPGWKMKEYADARLCLSAVSAGGADCVIISNYQYNLYERQCDKLNLAPIATGAKVELGFALNGDDNELYSILSRTVSLADSTAINATLTQYSAENAKSSFMDLITDNPAVGIIALTLLLALLIIIFEQQRIIRAKKEIKAKRHEMADLNKRIYTDRLTSVRNRDSFSEYIKDLQKKLDDLEPTEFAMAVFDCNGLNMINDKYGYEKGNEYIKAAANLICRTFKSSPVFRIEGDEFAAVLQKEDYENRRDLISKLEADQKEITASAANEWESVDVAIGLAEYNPRIDQTVGGTYRRAERLMYKEKPNRKYN